MCLANSVLQAAMKSNIRYGNRKKIKNLIFIKRLYDFKAKIKS